MDLTPTIVPKSDRERWTSIPGYEGAYEVSDLGNVRSVSRVTDRGRRWRGRVMTPTAMRSGYRTVTLWRGGRQRSALVHRLVLMGFTGEPLPGEEGLHIDGDQSNNTLANLRWGSHAENELDQVRHGTHRNASKDSCPAGHPYDAANTYTYPGQPHRACRECRRAYQREYQAKRREEARHGSV